MTSLADTVLRLMRKAPARFLSDTTHCPMAWSESVVRQCLIQDRGLKRSETVDRGLCSLLMSNGQRVMRKTDGRIRPAGLDIHSHALHRSLYGVVGECPCINDNRFAATNVKLKAAITVTVSKHYNVRVGAPGSARDTCVNTGYHRPV